MPTSGYVTSDCDMTMLSRVLDETASNIGLERGSKEYELLRQQLFVLFEVIRDEAQLTKMLQRVGQVLTAPPTPRRRRSPAGQV